MKQQFGKKIALLSLAATLASPVGLLAKETGSQPINLTIDTKVEGATLDPHVFGQFAEHLGTGIYGGIWVGPDSKIPNTRGIRNDVVAALKPLKIPNVRWPGGCFADGYHWRKGIGPQASRPKTMNSTWGGVIEPNSFGTHEFMDFIEQIESSAYVSGNVGSGTVQEMSDWLEYMTSDAPTTLAQERRANGRDKPFKVKILGVGNETWGCGGTMTAEYSADEYHKYATFVHNFDTAQSWGENKMLRVASGANGDDYHWTEVLMKRNSDFDAISLHNYSGFNQWPPHYLGDNFGEDEYAHVLKSALKIEPMIKRHSEVMDKEDPKKRVALAVDEWGSWYKSTPGTNPGFLQQQNSLRDAVSAGLHFNIFMRSADRVRMANIAQMINVLQAMIFTDGDKMVLTPTYYTFKMYVPFQNAKILKVNYDAGKYAYGDVELPQIDIAAAKASDGKIYLSLVNLDANKSVTIDVNALGFKAGGVKGQTLTNAKIDAVNTFEKPNNVQPSEVVFKAKNGKLLIELPKHSVSVLSLY